MKTLKIKWIFHMFFFVSYKIITNNLKFKKVNTICYYDLKDIETFSNSKN